MVCNLLKAKVEDKKVKLVDTTFKKHFTFASVFG